MSKEKHHYQPMVEYGLAEMGYKQKEVSYEAKQ